MTDPKPPTPQDLIGKGIFLHSSLQFVTGDRALTPDVEIAPQIRAAFAENFGRPLHPPYCKAGVN